jgi:hypothetical protein
MQPKGFPDRVSWVVLAMLSRSSSRFYDGACQETRQTFHRDFPYKLFSPVQWAHSLAPVAPVWYLVLSPQHTGPQIKNNLGSITTSAVTHST